MQIGLRNKMKAIQKTVLLLIVVDSFSNSEGYRILAIFPYHGMGHDAVCSPVISGLVKNNHQVDVMTFFPEKNPQSNYNVIINFSDFKRSVINNMTVEQARSFSGRETFLISTKYGNDICNLMKLDKMQEFIKNLPNNPPYDLFITEAFSTNCFFGFGHLLKVPVVAISPMSDIPWITDYMGNCDNTAFISHVLNKNFDRLNFWHRLVNTVTYYTNVFQFYHLTGEVQTQQMRKYLHPNIPHIRDLEKNVALMFINRHPIMYGSKPLVSSVVEISGLHINKNVSKLTPQLQKWLDESVHGVVYFSFGSMVLIESCSADVIKVFYKSFAKLAPVRVLMKIANKNHLPPGLPENVLTSSWIPQQAVLSHKNIRVFISHGGLQSSQEALYYGVPMIGIALFNDQVLNIEKFVTRNMAIKVNLDTISTLTLDKALKEILTDSKYRKNMQIYSRLFRDKPMEALDTVVFWIEFIIRNGGEVLRSPALELTWWQRALLDVYGFILLIIISFIILAYYVVKFLVTKCSSCSVKKLKKQ